MIVFHDEIDLVPGKMRVKRGGGAAGHNGLRSIDAFVGNDYWRVRIGVGHPGLKPLVLVLCAGEFHGGRPRSGWISCWPAMAEALPLMIEGQDSAYMSKGHCAGRIKCDGAPGLLSKRKRALILFRVAVLSSRSLLGWRRFRDRLVSAIMSFY